MFVLFQFEVDFYARFGIHVQFVGHPLVDIVQASSSKEAVLKAYNLDNDTITIGILPGSRQKEIENLLPIMLSAANILTQEFSKIQFLIMRAATVKQSSIEHCLLETTLTYRIIEEDTYNGINACDLCMVASGTATLETALLKKPMVIVYKTSFLTWLLAKLFVKIKNIGLVNVVAGKRIVPECIQFQATGKNIAKELKDIFTDEVRIADIKANLEKIKISLGEGESSQRAATEILRTLATPQTHVTNNPH